ncbi:MAG TPA: hypothetical protein VGJ84_02985 [Polyangiaceae bacterium]
MSIFNCADGSAIAPSGGVDAARAPDVSSTLDSGKQEHGSLGSGGSSGGADASSALEASSAAGASSTAGASSALSVEPPLVLCGANAGASGAGGVENSAGAAGSSQTAGAAGARVPDDSCAPPASVCGDSATLIYYENGVCVDGRCVWDQRRLQCSCYAGGCYRVLTT